MSVLRSGNLCVGENARCAAQWLKTHGIGTPTGLIVLGSGWAPVSDCFTIEKSWDFSRIPGLPEPTVRGHPGRLLVGSCSGSTCIVLVGRWHLYEGLSLSDVTLSAQLADLLGCSWMLCTNAAGGLTDTVDVGELVTIQSDLDLIPSRQGDGQDTHGYSGVSTRQRIYSPQLVQELVRAAEKTQVRMRKGTLALMRGPCYETAAEIRMLRRAGATVVSMSTVPEARAAALLGLKVAAISCVTNMAPGVPGKPISHEDVLDVLKRTRDDAVKLIGAWLECRASEI